MPLQPPPITPAFLAAVVGCSWSSNDDLLDGSGATKYPTVNSRSNDWELYSSGLLISQATYNSLKTSSANNDGSYTDSSGVSWWLEAARGWATPVAK